MKFSIIVPSRNGGKYLQACIESIITQDYDDYELIISDDHSTDNTKELLKTYLSHPNIKIIQPEEELSMTEHWEWALSYAQGAWQIFVGQDDGLQPYFFQHADKLIKIANTKKVRTIMSARAFYFWQGCEPLYGDVSINFIASNKIKLHNTIFEAGKALFGIHTYFELPEMYTTSLFHKSILDEVRQKQSGKVLTCHPQDANLAVIACSLEKYYLKSYTPLGWVGSSPKSAGMAIDSKNKNFNQEDTKTLKELHVEYSEKIKNSKYQYNSLAGDFSFGDTSIYFWQAFLETQSLRSKKVNDLLTSRLFKYVFFSTIRARHVINGFSRTKVEQFKMIVKKNRCSYVIVAGMSSVLIVFLLITKTLFLFYKAFRKISLMLFSVRVYINRSDNKDMSIKKASALVLEKLKRSGI